MMSLRARLAVAAGLVIVVVIGIASLIPRTVRSSQTDQLDRQLAGTVPVIGAMLVGAPAPLIGGPGGPRIESALSDLYVARVTDGHRDVLVAPTSTSGRAPALPRVGSAVGSPPDVATVASVAGAGSWRAIRLAAPDGGAEMVVAIPTDRVDATVHRVEFVIAAGGALVLAVMAAAGWWLIRLGLRPIAEVTEVADAITGGERARRVRGIRGDTEAAHLARAINVMLDEQQAAEERLRRFLADASHELRTPVAAIDGFADLWRHGAIPEGQLDDVMRRIGQESVRMRSLVRDLLLLAHLDEGRGLEHGPVDLVRLAHDAALDVSATHPSRLVEVTGVDVVCVEGDEERLRQVVANLLTNALVHTPGAVRIDLRQDADRVALTVTDDGPGMAQADAEAAFERFWRGDAGRSRPGSGLGLPIVRGIVDGHGGEVRIESDPAVGTRIVVVLPLREAAQRAAGARAAS